MKTRSHCAKALFTFLRLSTGLVASLVAMGCDVRSVSAFNPITLDPITEVQVMGGQVAVGDTVWIEADGYHQGNLIGTEFPRSVTFRASDTTIVRLEATHWSTDRYYPTVRVRGLREGSTTLFATINGVTGSGTIRVIPANK